jgi:calcium-dependent protein kinase
MGRGEPTLEGDRPLVVMQALQLDDIHLAPGVFIKSISGAFRKDYEVQKVLGKGSFGEVYLCKHKSTGVCRAIKEIPRGRNLQTEDDRLHFLREVEILARVDHPNIAKVYELYEDLDYFAVVSELISGGELFEYIVETKRLTESMAASVMLQLLSSLQYLHKCEIVHRDLKPENILLDQKPTSPDNLNIKIIDFGASATHTKGLHTVIGSLHYLAPEVYTMNYTEKCDMWSAGCILYVLLSGTMPFNGKTESQLRAEVENEDPKMTGALWKAISFEGKDFIRALLTKNPAIRPSAEQAISHSWLTKYARKRGNSTDAALAIDSLKQYSSRNKLRSAVSLFVATYVVTREEKQQLTDIFTSLDTDHNGVLTSDELISGLKTLRSPEESEALVETILTQVDLDHSGAINYSEFLSCVLDTNRKLSEEMLRKAFKLIDKDGSGKLDIRELKELLGVGLIGNEALWAEMMLTADKNGDGEIDVEEFVQLMRSSY